MPIYEYRCDNCGHELEAFQKHSEEPLTQCPQCETDNLRKRISATAFRLKGGGWYETDFKSGNKKNVAGSDGNTTTADSGNSGSDSGGDKKTSGGDKSAPSSGSSTSDSGS